MLSKILIRNRLTVANRGIYHMKILGTEQKYRRVTPSDSTELHRVTRYKSTEGYQYHDSYEKFVLVEYCGNPRNNNILIPTVTVHLQVRRQHKNWILTSEIFIDVIRAN